MIIVSQDREDIINFDNVKMINREENRISVDANFSKGDFYCIAEYATEERAKEVLQEIVSKYKTTLYNSKTNETVVNIPKVYEMPER